MSICRREGAVSAGAPGAQLSAPLSAAMASNIVVEWLRSLGLAHYAESFLDNGYDDLEICKQVGDPDLDAIGVSDPSHRARLLHSIRTLREEGAASVYFTLEETAAIQEEVKCESRGSSRSPSSTSSSRRPYRDEYEEGKAELVRIPKRQLKVLLKERLNQDGIRLSSQPYSTSTGERGYLEGVASRYAELYRTHYGDVLADLEELRQREWAELSPRMRVLPAPLTSSQSQPIYVPGKYSVSSSTLSPSSCLSDREEDEIYGFGGYGVYGKQMMQRQTNKLILLPNHNYHNCLSPRSAYFYEFPPNERPQKKKTSLSKLLRHLKTYRRDKSSALRTQANNRCMTPDGCLESMVGQASDYDRARLLKGPPQGTSFEETIHRLKVQEAMKKKERFDREQEEILRNIRRGMAGSDDTYMYDDEMHEMSRLGHHWYDEPPYESDPEDFLMADPNHHHRHQYGMSRRDRLLGGEVISLRSAGDISLSQGRPSRHRASRESADYAASSDVHSVCSRLSSLSMETTRSDQMDSEIYRRLRPYNGMDPTLSPGHSSDYAEHEDLMHSKQYVSGTMGQRSKTMGEGRRRHHHHHHHHHHRHSRHGASGSPLHRAQGPRPPSHSSAESLPSASSTQALVTSSDDPCRTGSPLEPQVVALARATQDSSPTPYDSAEPSLKFKKGEIIEVLKMSASGRWRGRLGSRMGLFRFQHVELLTEAQSRSYQAAKRRQAPHTLAQMLQAIHMEEHMPLFVLNGYEDLESFCEIKEKDLDYLGLSDPEHRAKILAAIQVLQEFETDGECSSSDAGCSGGGALTASNEGPNDLGAGERPSPLEPPSATQPPPFLPNIPLQPETAPHPPPRCCALSEKSSDSGVSSSSVSSSNQSKNKSRRNQAKPLAESPTASPNYENHHIDEETTLD